MHEYFDVVTIAAVLVATATAFLFRERPETPPGSDWAGSGPLDQREDGRRRPGATRLDATPYSRVHRE